jgi:hypothetical protein
LAEQAPEAVDVNHVIGDQLGEIGTASRAVAMIVPAIAASWILARQLADVLTVDNSC